MGIWKEIRIALNSTIGTNKFKPLDKLILEDVTIGAADSPVLKTLLTEEKVIGGTTSSTKSFTLGSFTTTKSGSVRCVVDVAWDDYSSPSQNPTVSLDIVRDDDVTLSVTIFKYTEAAYSNVRSSLYGDFEISSGHSYTITLNCTASSQMFTHLSSKICGSGIRDSIIK